MTALPSRRWTELVNEHSPADVAARLGLVVHRQGADVSFPCPACGKERRHSRGTDKRLAAKVMPNGRWWCEPCGAGGDAVALAATIVVGTTSPPRERWAEVRGACLGAGLCMDLPACDGAHRPSEPVATRPPAAEVARLWSACQSVEESSTGGRYLSSRGFRLDGLPWLHLVREAPAVLPEPFAWWPTPWLQGWPLVFPAYDSRGHLASIHARAVSRATEPKTRWPYRCSASGLLFADIMGVTFLRQCSRGASVDGLDAVVVAEGATDTLKLSEVVDGGECAFAVLGYVAGSKQAFADIDWPVHVPCLVATDDDTAGDRYAAEVRRALDWRTSVFRVRVPKARSPEGRKAGDWSDMSNGEVLEAITATSRWEVLNG